VRAFADGPAAIAVAESLLWIPPLAVSVVMLSTSLMLPLPWHGLVKFAIATAATTGLSLVLYETCVRYTFIGTQMNGPRSKPKKPSGSGSATT
jgi:hypothetical protein